LQVASSAAGVPAVQESTTDPLTHVVIPVEAQAPTPQDVGVETKSSSAAPEQSSSTPLHVASFAAGVPAVQESTTDPLTHVVVPVEAHTPSPQDVGVET